mgnify:CR=1 FL=1
MNQLVARNEFGNELATQDTASTAVAAQAKALVEARYIMAIRRPRDMDIVRERLEREFDLDLIATAPSVVYKIGMTDGSEIDLHNPADLPDPVKITTIAEPWIKATILVPDEYLGSILKLCQDRRGVQTGLTYVGGRAQVSYELPLNEVVFDFYDRLKSISKGYASFDYEFNRFQAANLVKLDVLINGDRVDALSLIVHRDNSYHRGRELVDKMQELIPRQMFDVAVQAAIGAQTSGRLLVPISNWAAFGGTKEIVIWLPITLMDAILFTAASVSFSSTSMRWSCCAAVTRPSPRGSWRWPGSTSREPSCTAAPSRRGISGPGH